MSTHASTLPLLVRSAAPLADGVLGLTLAHASGRTLPEWQPGAHLDLVLPSGTVRSYSLCGMPGADAYQIAVLLQPDGRGGSREIHEARLVGQVVQGIGPRNHFPLVPAARYVLIAGGIGITPFVPMLHQLTSEGAEWELHYLGRTRRAMAFLATVQSLAARAGRSLRVTARDETERVALSCILRTIPDGGAIYVCGPETLMAEAEAHCPAGCSLHLERFGRPALPPPVADAPEQCGPDESYDPDGPFEVEFRSSNQVVEVKADETILACARRVRGGLTFSCEDGYCGTCETRVLQGVPDHRDTVLSEEERSANTTMMICISRSRTRRLVLDL